MVARKPTAKEGGKKKTAPPADKSKKHAPTKQPKPVKEKTTKLLPKKKIRKGKAHGQAPVRGVAIYELVPETTQRITEVEGKGKGIATDEEAAQSLLDFVNATKILDVREEQGEDVSNMVALEENTAHGQAPVRGVAIYELVPETTQRITEVEGKGKGIATDEEAAQSLLDLYKPKKKSTTN
nr:hypothetical protein [Tanacetum cinerariifolium]